MAAAALSGCEAMERMDYLDRFFEEPRPSAVANDDQRPRQVAPPAPSAPYTSGFTQVAAPASADEWTTPVGAVVAMEPRPNPPPAERPSASLRARATETPANAEAAAQARTHEIVRQNRWVTRFWMELTPEQQGRVERRLQRGGTRLASHRADPAGAWDQMGLADRARLVFGDGPMTSEAAPASADKNKTWAGNR